MLDKDPPRPSADPKQRPFSKDILQTAGYQWCYEAWTRKKGFVKVIYFSSPGKILGYYKDILLRIFVTASHF